MFKQIKKFLLRYRYPLIKAILKLNGYTDYKKFHPNVESNDCYEKIIHGGFVSNIIKVYYNERFDNYHICSALYKLGFIDVQFNTFSLETGKKWFTKKDIDIILKLTNTVFKYWTINNTIIDDHTLNCEDYISMKNSNMDRCIDHFNSTVIFMDEFLKQTGKSIEKACKDIDEMLRKQY
nr:MAG TPA: hypothetical protein [Caudoviricetes sp.]